MFQNVNYLAPIIIEFLRKLFKLPVYNKNLVGFKVWIDFNKPYVLTY